MYLQCFFFFCYCYLACNKFCTIPCKVSNTKPKDRTCSKSEVIITSYSCSEQWATPVCVWALVKPQEAPGRADMRMNWFQNLLLRMLKSNFLILVQSGSCCAWNLTCLRFDVPCCLLCPLPVPGDWLCCSGCHIAALELAQPLCSFLGCLLLTKKPVRNSDEQGQLSTAVCCPPWYLVEISLLATCLSLGLPLGFWVVPQL